MRLVFPGAEAQWVERWQHLFQLVPEPYQPGNDEFYLYCDRGELVLRRGMETSGIRIAEPAAGSRSSGRSALSQALGAPSPDRLVVDATAGLGSDLLTLYARGYLLAAYERDPVLWALLDSHLRVRGIDDLTLTRGDALLAMQSAEFPEAAVIYLDPMFPEQGKNALPGKAMQYLRELLPEEDRAAELVAAARHLASDRVVLKRRRRDPVIHTPSWQVKGTTIRFDVYSARGG